MVHDPDEQGHHKYNSFFNSMLILRADASGTEILILLLYFKAIQLDLRTVTEWNTSYLIYSTIQVILVVNKKP